MLGVKQTTLITLYCTVCDNHSIIEERMQRLSNNRFPKFSDEECITAYLWGKLEGRSMRKDVYNFIRDYWHSWFPKLPSYQAFCRRLNNLVPAFQALAEIWSGMLCTQFEESVQYIIDSCPIILAKQSRSGSAKVAKDFCDKSYNSSRQEYYYGVKLHSLVIRRAGSLPVAETLMLSKASAFDLTAAKMMFLNTPPARRGWLLADKAYCDSEWADTLRTEHGIKIVTPRRQKKGDTLKSGDAYSTAVSLRRQPIESFFNWINSKFHIQTASFVRSSTGLLFHVFANIAAAMLFKLFNS